MATATLAIGTNSKLYMCLFATHAENIAGSEYTKIGNTDGQTDRQAADGEMN